MEVVAEVFEEGHEALHDSVDVVDGGVACIVHCRAPRLCAVQTRILARRGFGGHLLALGLGVRQDSCFCVVGDGKRKRKWGVQSRRGTGCAAQAHGRLSHLHHTVRLPVARLEHVPLWVQAAPTGRVQQYHVHQRRSGGSAERRVVVARRVSAACAGGLNLTLPE